jgi:hypothetical protein
MNAGAEKLDQTEVTYLALKKNMTMAVRFLLLISLFLVPNILVAQPPENADPALASWFQSLKQPHTGGSCCSIADCRPVDYRMGPEGYEIFVESNWIKVPSNVVINNKENPVGRGVACLGPVTRNILCFVPASEI